VTYDELMRSIDTAAAERKRELGEKAVAEAEAIRKAAVERAGGFRTEAMARAERKVAAEREMMLSRVRQEVKLEFLKRRNELAERAFDASRGRVLAMRTSPSYRDVVKRLAVEAIGLAGGTDLVFHVDPRDRSLFEGILRELGRNSEIATDIETAGGLTVTSRDGKILVTNTLESRLARARDLLKGEVFSTLGGG
jgi:V/A-type H+/Na+-transporting ATPase subunit E